MATVNAPDLLVAGIAAGTDTAIVVQGGAVRLVTLDNLPLSELTRAALSATQQQIQITLSGKADTVHTQTSDTITDLPAVATLKDFSSDTGTRSTDAIIGLEARLAALEAAILPNPPTAPTQSTALTLNDSTPDVGQTVTITAPTWSAAVTNVRYRIVISGVIDSTQTSVSFVPTLPMSGLTGYITPQADWAGGTVTGSSVSFTVNAAAAAPWTEGSSFSSTNSIKALALAADDTAMFIAESIVVASGGGSPTAPTYRASNVGTSSSGSPVSVATTSFQNGDFVLLVWVNDYFTDVTPTWPAGATEIISTGQFNVDGTVVKVAWLVISGTPPATYDVSFSGGGGGDSSLTAIAWSGVNATPIDFATYLAGSTFRSSPIDIPNAVDTQLSGTTGFDNDVLVFIGVPDISGGTATSQTAPSGFTERVDNVANSNAPIEIATKTQASAGATGDITGATGTFSAGTAAYVCALVAIRGAGGGGGAQTSNGIIAKSARSGSNWAAKSTAYNGDGVASAADEGWYTGVACASDGSTIVIGAASNGYAGPGYAMTYDLVNDEQVQRWVGTFDAPAGSAWPDALACSSDTFTRIELVRGSTNEVWTLDGTELGLVVPTSTAVPLTPTAFGNRVALSGSGLRFAVVNATVVDLYARASIGANWSKVATITPRAAGLISVGLSRDTGVLAMGTSAGIDVYTGTWPSYTWQQLLPPTGGGYSSLGLGLALDGNGNTIIASEFTASAATGTVRSEKTSVVRTWVRN